MQSKKWSSSSLYTFCIKNSFVQFTKMYDKVVNMSYSAINKSRMIDVCYKNY